jgi:hypothetical protein
MAPSAADRSSESRPRLARGVRTISRDVSSIEIVCVEIFFVHTKRGPYQYGERRKGDQDLQRRVQSMRHGVPLPSERRVPLLHSLHRRCCSGLQVRSEIEVEFFTLNFRFGKFRPAITQNWPHNHPKVAPGKAKRPPGNRAASSLGRIVPTEAKPSELSGEILSLAK